MKKHTWQSNRFTLELTEDQAVDGSHQGDCTDDIRALVNIPEIASQFETIPPDSIRKELREYGAWDDTELADDAANRERILWIACGDIREEIRHPSE